MEHPKYAGELYQWIGFTGWSEDKIPRYREIERPLRDIVNKALQEKGSRKKRSIDKVTLASLGWGSEHELAFEELRHEFVNAMERGHYDPELVTCVWTDASQLYYGGAVTQCTPDELKKPVREQKHVVLITRL